MKLNTIKIMQMMEEQGIDSEELARRIGISSYGVGRFLAAQSTKLSTIVGIAKALGVEDAKDLLIE